MNDDSILVIPHRVIIYFKLEIQQTIAVSLVIYRRRPQSVRRSGSKPLDSSVRSMAELPG